MNIRTPLTFASADADAGLRVALAEQPDEIVAQIVASGLRGRGGAGFPTGTKWRLAARAPAPDDRRYVVCNADEGEPGTFKDRVLLTQFPDLVVEGMTIAARAIGAREGIVYLRGEYAYLLRGLEECLVRRRASGLLGEDLAGSGTSFDVRVHLGGGSYVCGEESALLESLEGRRGIPRSRPPYPVTRGLFGAPTVVNNVETLAWAAMILARGAEWFAGIGTKDSPGPKLVSVSGDVSRPGVYEFPFGVPVRAVLAAAGGEDARAAIVGGASGMLVPADDFDRTLCHEDVATGGAVIVLGPHRDLLEVAENLQAFFVSESCGECTPCRAGNPVLLEGIRALRRGECTDERLEDLVRLGHTMQVASKCGLGQSSPNVFLSLVEHHRSELLAHELIPV
jgi:[NiFe] hydrogenase diaphorase moiety large subunit